jgi:dihydroorotase
MRVPGRLTAVYLRGTLIDESGRTATPEPTGQVIGATRHGFA